MENCKYRLPCGRCEKFNKDCDAPRKNCNHNWIIEVEESDYRDERGNRYFVVHQHCPLCGTFDSRLQTFKT